MGYADGDYIYDTHWKAMQEAIKGNGIVSGLGGTPGPGAMEITLADGKYIANGESILKESIPAITVTAADPALDRWDLISGKSDGTITYTAGTPANPPIPPDLPTDEIIIRMLLIPAAATPITAGMIRDLAFIPQPTIEIAITDVGDYSGDLTNLTHKLFPWDIPTKLADPGALPAGTAYDCSWSPNGEFLVISHEVSPYITIYKKSGTTFTKLADPGALPTGSAYGSSWSPNGEFLVVSHQTSPFITIYQRSGTTFTKLADPAALPSAQGSSCSWSPNGEFLAITHPNSPYVTIYQRAGTTFTKLADPAALPAGNGNSCSWSPNGEFLAITDTASPYITIYQRTGTTFTKLADPAAPPAGNALGNSWSPNGEFLAITHVTSPYITIYQRSGTTFTKLADPAALPAGNAENCSWSPNGEFLAIAYINSPYVSIYQTNENMPDRGMVIIANTRREGT